jgi:WD40 repeat protein/tRNA A-37 threonylcarbamoyl transferase component Bud32
MGGEPLSQSEDSALAVNSVDVAIAEYLRRMYAGEDVDREEFLRQHPDIVEELRDYFSNYDRVCELASVSPALPFRGDAHRNVPFGVTETSKTAADPAAALRDPEKELPRRFGDYELLEVVGRGGMGVVYRCRQISLKRYIALKMIRQQHLATAEDIERFRTEAEAAAGLQHTNIVAIHAVGEHDGQIFYTMDYVIGSSLAGMLRDGPLRTATAAEYLKTIALAIYHAHVHRVLHRDLTPANVLIDANDQPCVTDFGIAMRLGARDALTAPGHTVGTPGYMSPEQSTGEHATVGVRSDVYSLGATLYAMLTGRPPFRGETAVETLIQVRETQPVSPRLLNPAVPKDLETICLKCLHKDPARRYQTAKDLADDIERFLNGQEVFARPIGHDEILWRWCKRNPLVAGLAAVVMLLVSVIVAGTLVGYFHEVELRGRAEIALASQSAALQSAQQAQQSTQQAQRKAERRLAKLYLDRGRNLGKNGDIAHGMHWLVRSLESISPATADLVPCIRQNIQSSYSRLHELLKVTELGSLSISASAFSPDCRTIFIGCETGVAQLYDVATGRPMGSPMTHKNQDYVSTVAYSPDGKTLVTGSFDKTARVWDANSGKPVGRPLQHPENVLAVAFSPDGNTIVTGTYDGFIRLWDVASGEPVGHPISHQNEIRAVAFSPDGKLIVSGGQDGCVRLWEAATGEPVGHVMRHESGVRTVAFSPDSKTIVTGSRGGGARLWDVAKGTRVGQRMQHHGEVAAVAFSPDGKKVLTGSSDKTGRLWNGRSGAPRSHPLRNSYWVTAVAFSPDGKRVFTGSGSIRTWAADDETTARLRLPHHELVTSVAFSADGEVLLTGSHDRTARLWNADSGEPLGQTISHDGPVAVAACVPGGKMVVTGSHDTSARLWNATTGESIGEPLKHRGNVTGVASRPDGRTLLTVGDDDTVHLWDIRTRKHIGDVFEHPTCVFGVKISPDGRTVVTRSEDSIARLWSFADGSQIAQLPHNDGWVAAVAFSPDGKTVVTGSYDKTARLWNAATGEPLGKPMSHPDEVWAVAFSPDSKTVATGCYDHYVRLWDVSTRMPIGLALKNKGLVAAVVFSPDGNSLLAGSQREATLFSLGSRVTIPAQIPQLVAWIEMVTGLELSAEGLHVLDMSSWNERRRFLKESGDFSAAFPDPTTSR